MAGGCQYDRALHSSREIWIDLSQALSVGAHVLLQRNPQGMQTPVKVTIVVCSAAGAECTSVKDDALQSSVV